MKALGVAAGILIVLSATVAAASAAPHDDFHNKWPWHWPPSSARINTLPFQGVHGCQPGGECVAAYDFGISDDGVMSASEGQVTGLVEGVTLCGSNLHYGNFVDVDGKRYAHLVAPAPSVVLGANLFQGDAIGTQGHTGNVQPCDNQDPQSGKHLHWEFRGASAVPAKIDGVDTGPLAEGGYPESSNSVIGEFSTSGATLRTYYQAHGGFNSIGWTTKHCPGTCTLDMTNNLQWGRMQDFQHDADGYGGTFNTIHVANDNQTHAFLVDSTFWPAWASASPPIGMAIADRGTCPSGRLAGCLFYQPFQFGFVWMDSFTGRIAVYCPDVNRDGTMNAWDIAAINGAMGTHVVAYDLDGDGTVDLADYNRAAFTDGDHDGLSNIDEFPYLADPCKPDTDADGCGDGKETSFALSPINPWDFYSVPVPALFVAPSPLTTFRDSTVAAGDAQAVFAYFKKSAKTGSFDYEQDRNGNGTKDGVEYDRSFVGPAKTGAPDGIVGASDAQLAFAQFKLGYKC